MLSSSPASFVSCASRSSRERGSLAVERKSRRARSRAATRPRISGAADGPGRGCGPRGTPRLSRRAAGRTGPRPEVSTWARGRNRRPARPARPSTRDGTAIPERSPAALAPRRRTARTDGASPRAATPPARSAPPPRPSGRTLPGASRDTRAPRRGGGTRGAPIRSCGGRRGIGPPPRRPAPSPAPPSRD